MRSDKLLYPVLGTGCFFILFLIGYVLAERIGLHVLTGTLLGFLTGCAGVTLVVQLEALESRR